MTREEYEIFRDEVLVQRFYWTGNISLRNFLTNERGCKYLFRCTHYKTDKYFWVFDKSDELMKDVEEWKSTHKKAEKEVKESIALDE